MLSFLFAMAIEAGAFPDLSRHGYQNCTACHFAPSGGGVLTPYGNMISRELLSRWQWSKESEAQIETEEGDEAEEGDEGAERKIFHLGGDARALQLYVDNEQMKQYAFFPMQLDVEPLAQLGSWTMTAVLGYTKKRSQDTREAIFISRRHWIMYQPSIKWSIRAGRFFPQFGFHVPDHIRLARSGLGFDQGRETYNLEVQYQSERVTVSATGILQRAVQDKTTPASGGTFTAKIPIFTGSQLGVHLLRVRELNLDRKAFCLTGFLALSEKTYSMTELIHQEIRSPNSRVSERLFSEILGFEVTKGVVPFLGVEGSFSQSAEKRHALIGLQTFPLSHLEFKFEWQNRVEVRPEYRVENWAFLQLHYYL